MTRQHQWARVQTGLPEGPIALYVRRAFLGPLSRESNGCYNHYVAPRCADIQMPHVLFEGFSCTMIVVGRAEMLVDPRTFTITRLRNQDAVHNFIIFPFCEPERTLALDAIAS